MATFTQSRYGSKPPANPVHNIQPSVVNPFIRTTGYRPSPLSSSFSLSDVARAAHPHVHMHQWPDGQLSILLDTSRHPLNSQITDQSRLPSPPNTNAHPDQGTNHDSQGLRQVTNGAYNAGARARTQSPQWPCSTSHCEIVKSSSISGHLARPTTENASLQPSSLMPGVLVNAFKDVDIDVVDCNAQMDQHEDYPGTMESTNSQDSQACGCQFAAFNSSLAACIEPPSQSTSKRTTDASSNGFALSRPVPPPTRTYDSSLESISTDGASPVMSGTVQVISLTELLHRLEVLKEEHCYLSKSPVRDSRKWQAYEFELRQSVSGRISKTTCSSPRSKTAVGCFLVGNNLCEICNVIVLDRRKFINTLDHTEHPGHIQRCENLLSSIREAYDDAQQEVHNHTSTKLFRAFRRLIEAGIHATKLGTLKTILELAEQGGLSLDPAHVLDNATRIKALGTRKQARYSRILSDIQSGDTQFLRGFGGSIDGARRYLEIVKPVGNRRVRPTKLPFRDQTEGNDTNRSRRYGDNLHGYASADSPRTISSLQPHTLPLTTRSDDGPAFYSWWSSPKALTQQFQNPTQSTVFGAKTMIDNQVGLDGLNRFQRNRGVSPPQTPRRQNERPVPSSPDSWTKHIATPSHESWVRCTGSRVSD